MIIITVLGGGEVALISITSDLKVHRTCGLGYMLGIVFTGRGWEGVWKHKICRYVEFLCYIFLPPEAHVQKCQHHGTSAQFFFLEPSSHACPSPICPSWMPHALNNPISHETLACCGMSCLPLCCKIKCHIDSAGP